MILKSLAVEFDLLFSWESENVHITPAIEMNNHKNIITSQKTSTPHLPLKWATIRTTFLHPRKLSNRA